MSRFANLFGMSEQRIRQIVHTVGNWRIAGFLTPKPSR
jgi:hypothetical protein